MYLDNVRKMEEQDMENSTASLPTDKTKSNSYDYSQAYKRMKIEKLFENLNLNDSKQTDPSKFTKLEDVYLDSQCFSIEIHKVNQYPTETNAKLRKRKKATHLKKIDKDTPMDGCSSSDSRNSDKRYLF